MSSQDPILEAFRRIWGYTHFRSPQGEIINCLLQGQDALVVMPTGGGKSICFQLPALLQTGVTLVISPLVALMENQVAELRSKGLPGGLLHSQLSKYDRHTTLQRLTQQTLRLLYLSPETLLSPSVWEVLTQPDLVINGLILDEAHCLVQWGETFRPAYRRLGAVRSSLLRHKPPGTRLPIAAFTATADPQTQATLRSVLQLQRPQQFLINPYRPNLDLRVQWVWTPPGHRQRLNAFLESQNRSSGLVYVRSRRQGEEVAQWLKAQGYRTEPYHAGLAAGLRRNLEQQWQDDRLQFVVCTNAFGMGINKPDVRWVVHYQPPLLLSEYVQEVGRAGRDGKPSTALALVSEPTGWLNSNDRQQRLHFTQELKKQYRQAQGVLKTLPHQGTVSGPDRDSALELALGVLHSAGQVIWLDPFTYQRVGEATGKMGKSKIFKSIKTLFKSSDSTLITQKQAFQDMTTYFYQKNCRWSFLLTAFGFPQKLPAQGCGHCDRCQS